MQARFPDSAESPAALERVKPGPIEPRLAPDQKEFYFRHMKILSPVLIALSLGACAANPGPATAQMGPVSEQQPTIHINATATVRQAPDVAVVQLAVETLAATAREASNENAALMDRVLRAVHDQGVPRQQIRTQRLELRPRYDNRRDGRDPSIVGYQAVNQITVRLHDVAGTGAVVDAAVGAGANRVTGIHFELEDPESAYHEALRNAIAKARAEAEVAAAALGLRLGEPVQVSTGGYNAPGPMYRAEAMVAMDQSGAPPVEPGEVEVRATVSIAWRLGS
jgi:uncharacterized protein YggE